MTRGIVNSIMNFVLELPKVDASMSNLVILGDSNYITSLSKSLQMSLSL